MTFSFDPALSTPKDRVRLLLGDTEPPGLVSDETINGLLVTVPAPTYAAAMLADSLAAKYAAQVDMRIGSTQVSASQASKAFAALADRLRAQGPGDGDGSGVATAGDMYVGGVSHAVVDELRRDSDAVQPSFSVGQDDHYGENPSPRSTSWDGG